MLPLARSASTTAYHATMAEIGVFAGTNLPVASTTTLGGVKIDGSTVTITSGTISAAVATPSSLTPVMDGAGNAGTATTYSRADHVHPSDTARLPLAGGTMTGPVVLAGVSTAPTATAGTNTTQIASTAFVQAQMVASGAGVSTWNTRAGAVVLQQADITAVGALHDVGRNLLHNPLFNVQQRGQGPWTTTSYTLDRWQLAMSLDTVNVSTLAISDAQRAAIGDEQAYFAPVNTFTGNAGAGAYNFIRQPIEGLRRLAGKTVTVSFWAWDSAGALRLGVSLLQLFGTGGSPSPVVAMNGIAVTLSTTPTRYSATFNVPSASGKTLGTNGDDCTYVNLWYSSGATNNTAAGGIGVQSGTINLWGVQLEIGSVATPLEKPDPRYDLSNCQRFYQTGAMINIGVELTAGAAHQIGASLLGSMRATPTMVVASNSNANITGFSLGALNASYVFTGGSVSAGNTLTTINITFTASADL
ncbi:MAG TPA: hypothetical protein VGH84_06675 [Steroidobacteraceae bacterium]